MTVRVIVDSSACVPAEQAERLGIRTVPLGVFRDGDLLDAGDVSVEDLLAAIDAGHRITTSAPTPGDFLDAIDAGCGSDAVIITVAATMSATHRSAVVAARAAGATVEVVDSGTAAGGHGLVAIAAARAARTGSPVDRVAAEARSVAGRVRLLATVGSLDHLVRSGRVPAAAGAAGRALGIRPLFEFRDGRPVVRVPAVSPGGARQRIVQRCLRGRGPGRTLHAGVLHAGRRSDAQLLAAAVQPHAAEEVLMGEFDASMVLHSGPDVLGLSWWWDRSGRGAPRGPSDGPA